MKHILLYLILIPSIVFSQNIDTVWVRNITMTSGDWAYLAGKALSRTQDSIMIVAVRKIRAVVQVQNPANFNTNVTIDSLSGRSMIEWYKILLFAPFVEVRTRGGNIFTAITGKANLTTFITEIDNSVSDLFLRERTRGKNYLLDSN